MGAAARIFALRHAPAVVRGICYGRTDVDVTPGAADCARELEAHLAQPIVRIFSSDSARANQLGEAFAERVGLPFCADPRLRELDFGDWEGLAWDDIYRHDPAALTHWANAPLDRAPPNGETGLALITRVADFLRNENVHQSLLVCHAGPIRAMRGLSRLGTLDAKRLSQAALDFDRSVAPLVIEPIDLFP